MYQKNKVLEKLTYMWWHKMYKNHRYGTDVRCPLIIHFETCLVEREVNIKWTEKWALYANKGRIVFFPSFFPSLESSIFPSHSF